MEQSSLFGDGVDIDTETPASEDTAAPADARAAELRHELDYHAYRYYMLDAPEITDAAFDKMLVELQQIEATYPDLVTPDSYTQRVGGYVSEQFTPVTHMARMYSMDDAMDLDELDAWLQRTEDALASPIPASLRSTVWAWRLPTKTAPLCARPHAATAPRARTCRSTCVPSRMCPCTCPSRRSPTWAPTASVPSKYVARSICPRAALCV